MLNINIVKFLTELKKCTRQYTVHGVMTVKPKVLENNHVHEDKIINVIDRQVFAPCRKVDKELKFYVDTAIDNKANYLLNLSWGMQISIWRDTSTEDILEMLVIYLPIEDTIFYWVNGSGFYIQRNEKIEQLTVVKNPSTIGSLDNAILTDTRLYYKICHSEYMDKVIKLNASGSILHDIVMFMVGKFCLIAIHNDTLQHIGENALKILKREDIESIKYDGTVILLNRNAIDLKEVDIDA